MKRKITDEYIDTQLKFGLQVALGLDMLAKHENALNIVQAVVSQILIELGYSQQEAYGAAITLHIMQMDTMINDGEISATLPALVSTAARVIRKNNIPDFVKEQVERTLADQKQ